MAEITTGLFMLAAVVCAARALGRFVDWIELACHRRDRERGTLEGSER